MKDNTKEQYEQLLTSMGYDKEAIDSQLKEVATKMVVSTWSDLYARFGNDLAKVDDKKGLFEYLYHRSLGMVTLEDGRKLIE